MGHRIKTILLVLFAVFLISGALFATNTRLLFVAPGETFTPGAAKTGAPLPQVEGVPFVMTVYSVDDAPGWQYVQTNASVSVTAQQATTYNPTSPFNLNLSDPLGAVPACRNLVTFTVSTADAPGTIRFDGSANGGVLYNSVTITVQKLTTLSFTTMTTPWTAGVGLQMTITARDQAGATCTNYQGAVALNAVYATGATTNNTVSLGTINFVNGIATPVVSQPLILYQATDGAQRVTITAATTTPALTGMSTNFVVSSQAAATQLIVIGPGQQLSNGVNSGNGRIGGLENCTVTQTAGTYFYVTVYAVDAFFNTVTAATGNVTLSSSDPQLVVPPVQTLTGNNGKLYFKVTLGTVGATAIQTITVAHATYTQDIDSVWLTFGVFSKFGFSNTIANHTAGSLIQYTALALDAYNNTVTSFNNTATIDVIAGGVPVDTNHMQRTTTPTFSAGILSLNGVRVYESITNAILQLSYGGISINPSNVFSVLPAAANKLILLAPGETLDQGNISGVGKTGSPAAQPAGASVPFTVYMTDANGNWITTNADFITITSSDINGTANGVTPPVQIQLLGGTATFNYAFVANGTQSVTCTDAMPNSTINPGTDSLLIQAGTLSDFVIDNAPVSPQSTDTNTVLVRARDKYKNIITGYTGNVWMTSPGTDWTLPAETTLSVTITSSNTPCDLVQGYKWHVTFTPTDNGSKSLIIGMHRAMPSAYVFVSDVESDANTYTATGHWGLSAAVNVRHAPLVKMQVIPPGMTSRPGTSDGVNGSPTGQIVGSVFSVTVSAVDAWWNPITTAEAGYGDQIALWTNDTGNSGAAPTGQSLTTPIPNQPTGIKAFLNSGSVIMDVKYIVQSPNFNITAHDDSTGGVTNNTCPNINVFAVDHFKITAVNNGNIGVQTAGVPFTISITAYTDITETNIATGFDNTWVELRASNNWSDSFYCISDTQSITFTAGIAVMPITMYRASVTWFGGGVTVQTTYGNKTNQSQTFSLKWGTLDHVLIIVDGMTQEAGLRHVGIPGYAGYIGSPITFEAGAPHYSKILYLDYEYNQVLDLPPAVCAITSSDPSASVGITMTASGVYVTTTAGAFETYELRLRTVGANGIQTVYAEPGGALAESHVQINVRHTTQDHFSVIVPATAVAGVPFNVTISALDPYGNVCDDTNGGVPFTQSVDLNASTGSNTMFPYTAALTNGIAVKSVQLFQAPNLNNVTIKASISPTNLGISAFMSTISNEFKRLLVYDSSGGTTRINGVFTGTSPDISAFPMVTGAPFSNSPGSAVVSYQSGGIHYGEPHNFVIMACDYYGNITGTPDLAGQTVTVMTDDIFAVPVTPTTIPLNGQQPVQLIFHTAMQGVSITAHTTFGGVADYTTNTFTTLAGPAYGLQCLVPGMYAVEGSGNTIAPYGPEEWFNGVTGAASTQASGAPFPVTVQSCDIFGNFQPSSSQQVRVIPTGYSDAGGSYPTSANQFIATLGDDGPGRVSLTANIDVILASVVNIQPEDISGGSGNLTRVWVAPVSIFVALSTDFDFEIIVNGVPFGGSNSTQLTVLPDTFAMTVNVIDRVMLKPAYSQNGLFQLDAVYASNLSTTASGMLAITSDQVVQGRWTTTLQGYDKSQSIRIRVTDPSGKLATRYSCVINFGANAENALMTLTASPNSIGSGKISHIRAALVDSQGNSVPGQDVQFELLPASSTGSGYFGDSAISITIATSDSHGIADVPFTGGYINGRCVLKATYILTGATALVNVNVSIVDPASMISNYPNPFMAGAEKTYISFFAPNVVAAKMKIYNLFGDLVWSHDYSEADMAALVAVYGNMVTVIWDGRNTRGKVVGNGGYLAVVQMGGTKYTRKIAVRK
jgi:hypothetical protein